MRTKKAVQELTRVFNKLASKLTVDLNEAGREIESLKREIRVLKSKGTGPTTHRNTTRRKTGNRSASHPKTTTQPSTTTSTPSPSMSHHTSHETSKSNEEPGYVFPQEPYNPPSPPEPSLPGNN